MRSTFKRGLSLVVLTLLAASSAPQAIGQLLSGAAMSQMASLIADKQNRTPEEQKLDSNLLFAMRAIAQKLSGATAAQPAYVESFIAQNVNADNTIAVTIRARVSDDLLAALTSAGAQNVVPFPDFDSVTATLPITELLAIAALSDVHFIRALEKPVTNRFSVPPDSQKIRTVAKIGSVTSQGVVAHSADLAFDTGINGAGTLICVLSDGVTSYASRQATGDLPTPLHILSGQQGSGDEGTAMLEIAYDMAPGTTLGFATGDGGEAQMATNILNLQSVFGCGIIADDVTYFTESAFQDGPIAQAVNTVTAAGAMYFSSAANSGNLTDATSGTWEGDWTASGFEIDDRGTPVPIQLFGANPYDTLEVGVFGNSSQFISLKWSDPNGASSNDYDLFLLDSTGSVVLQQSTNAQTGTQDPFEGFSCSPAACPAGSLVVVALASGQARALRIDTNRGTLSVATDGSTFGHNAASTALTIAAVDVANADGGAFTGGAADPVEVYSSDGPRKIFYNPNGVAITPGNFLFSTNGGVTLAKVDMTAADGVSTAEPSNSGLNPFFGTSAATPHAAAIAALVKSANPGASATTIKNALFTSALDIEAPGWDPDSGYGIVMAPAALRAVLNPLGVSKAFSPATIASGGTSTLTLTLTNSNAVALQGVAWVDTYPAQIKNAASPSPGENGAGCTGTLAATANGGTFSMTSGVVPAGATCNIFVTVTSATPGTYVDNTGAVATPIALDSAAASASLNVELAPTITSANSTSFTYGALGSFTVTTTGTPVAALSETGTLPSAVGFVDNGNGTATLSGTPITAGTFPLTITANNGLAPNATQAFTLTVNATVPGSPIIGTATGGNAQATVTFSAPTSNGGSPITGYTAISNPAGGVDSNAGTTGTSHLVTGLTNGTSYTFTVTAKNAIGTGAPSAASNSVTPEPLGSEACGGEAYPFPYTDVSGVGAAFCPGIMEAYVTGVSKGTTPTTFSPNETVTRVQMTTFLQRSLDQELTRATRPAALNQWSTPQVASAMQSVAVGGSPTFCAADGQNIWTSTFGTVVRVQANSGKILGTWTGATTSQYVLVAAGKVFVTGYLTADLYVIDPTQPPGAVSVAASNLGNGSLGIAFDGANIWTANQGGSVSIITLQATTPYPVTTVTTGFAHPVGLVYDGGHIWVTDGAAGTLLKLDPAGAILQTVAVGAGPQIPVFDGANIWVPNVIDNSITVVQASTGNVVATINADSNNQLSSPVAASFDGERVLVANSSGNTVTLFKAADLSFIANVATGVSSLPNSVCSDGINFWVPLQNSGSLLRF